MSLEKIDIPIPCPVAWESMKGDDRRRFCSQCRKNVYNISAMTRTEAEAFIQKNEGQACIQMYKRPDGTVVTADCRPLHPPIVTTRTAGLPRPSK